MSRGFVKEGDQEEIPMVLPRAFLPQGVPNYVTPEGLRLLQHEMESLKEEWTVAGSNYVTKNYLDAKMSVLSERINSAVVVDTTKANPEVISFGMYVRYNDKTIRIVGVDEADASKGLISFLSPIAKSLIGKRKGDKFEIKVPKGVETIEIQGVFESCELQSINRAPEVGKANVPIKKVRSSAFSVQSSELPSTGSDADNVTGLEANSQQPTSNSQQPKFKVINNPTDFLPIVNERGNIVGRALHLEIHNGNKLLHPAVHLLVYNSNKEIVAEYNWHVAFGETPEKTLKRKLKESESLVETYGRMSENIKPKFKKQYIREDKNEKELVTVFVVNL